MKNIPSSKQNYENKKNAQQDKYPDDEFDLPGQHANPNKTNLTQPNDQNFHLENSQQNSNKTKTEKEEVSKYINEGNPNAQKTSQYPEGKKPSNGADCGCADKDTKHQYE